MFKSKEFSGSSSLQDINSPVSKVHLSSSLVVYYGEPKDPAQIPKKFADKESIEAAYFSM